MFRASWPILIPDFPISMLKVEACEQLDEMAREAGCRLVGAVSWTVLESHLIAQVAAVPLSEGLRRAPRTRVRGVQRKGRIPAAGPNMDSVRDVLAGRVVTVDPATLAVVLDVVDDGKRSAEKVAERVGCTQRTVQRHRSRRREQQQRKGRAA